MRAEGIDMWQETGCSRELWIMQEDEFLRSSKWKMSNLVIEPCVSVEVEGKRRPSRLPPAPNSQRSNRQYNIHSLKEILKVNGVNQMYRKVKFDKYGAAINSLCTTHL